MTGEKGASGGDTWAIRPLTAHAGHWQQAIYLQMQAAQLTWPRGGK